MMTPFVDLEKQYREDWLKYTTEEDRKALYEMLNSAVVDGYEHEMNNSALDTSFGKTMRNLRNNQCTFIGISVAPYIHGGDDIAFVFEDNSDFKRYWYHINETLLNWWREQPLY